MPKEREGRSIKKKYCKLCFEKVGFVDYKDEKRLGRFITDRGKIVPRRISGNCAKCQRKFFTPNTYYNDVVGAFEYLRSKFDRHQCNGEPIASRTSRESIWASRRRMVI